MKKTTYICDICQDILQEKWDKPVKKTFVGFHFFNVHLVTTDHRSCERHICFSCLDDLSKIYDLRIENKDKNWVEKNELKSPTQEDCPF